MGETVEMNAHSSYVNASMAIQDQRVEKVGVKPEVTAIPWFYVDNITCKIVMAQISTQANLYFPFDIKRLINQTFKRPDNSL